MSSRAAPFESLSWALSSLGASSQAAPPELSAVAGDASARRYFRFNWQGRAYILAEAPPATEKNAAFLANGALLQEAGIRTPVVYAADLEQGFLLLEDFGDQLLLPTLNEQTADAHYGAAFDILERMASLELTRDRLQGEYDEALLQEELGRFSTWFVEALLQCELNAEERSLLTRFERVLIDSALAQPQVLVHRDFHSRNLMLLTGDALGVIDFQDAVLGPLTYDLVSLLRDCYIRWPAQRVRNWALLYRQRLAGKGMAVGAHADEFMQWFDYMGLQRHIKVLGTFARLYLRDGKQAYLDDLPLVLEYVGEVLDAYAAHEPVVAEFRDWFALRLSPVIAQQSWSRAS